MSQCYKAVWLVCLMQHASLSGGVMLYLKDVQNFLHLCILAVLFNLVFNLNEWLVLHLVVKKKSKFHVFFLVGGNKFSYITSSCCFKMCVVSLQTTTAHRFFVIITLDAQL